MDPVAQQPVQPAYQEQVPPPQAPQEQNVARKGLSKTYLLGGLVLVVVLLTGGLLAYVTFLSPKTATTNNASLSNSYTQKQTPKADQVNPATDTSDTQINKDLDNIDSSLTNLDSGSTAVDQGFNDQAVNLQ